MNKKINAILIHPNDNVVTSTEMLGAGEMARYRKKDGVIEIVAIEEIPKFHKIAVTDINEKDPIYKYGQLIGVATKDISRGKHVHDHNIQSPNMKIQAEASPNEI